MTVALLTAAVLSLLGHVALCLWANNHVHALGLHRNAIKALSKPIELFGVAAPLAAGWWAMSTGWSPLEDEAWQAIPWTALLYGAATAGVAVVFLPAWLRQQLTQQDPTALLSNHTTEVDLGKQLGTRLTFGGLGHVYLRIPGNQSLCLHTHEKELRLPRLPKQLDGLSIAHLSDLHFTGRLGKAYFEEVVRRANDLQADLIAITGDLVDKTPCIDWLADTLVRLRAPHGVYFVLGNHDLRVDTARVRRVLVEAGLSDLSGRWLRRELRGSRVVLAGNELPWIRPAADLRDCVAEPGCERDFRIALSHSPDQIGWARSHDIDLMLAGHTHGGQICFPLIGAILAPSHYGVRYAAGTFELPPTVMHVSRGISGLQPLRFNCPPELARLVLRRR